MKKPNSKYEINDKSPSDAFLDALPGGGGYEVQCQCGRDHFCPDSDAFETDEDRASFLNMALLDKKTDPTGVEIHYDYDAIEYKLIEGKVYVISCPCNGLYKYENWIWTNRDIIRRYLLGRCQQELEWAEQEVVKNKLAGFNNGNLATI